MTEVISVRFRSGCKIYYFSPGQLHIEAGQDVIVETAQGAEYVTCTEGNHPVEDHQVVEPLRRVLRLATENDRRSLQLAREREKDAFAVCQKKIAQHGLEMKLVEAVLEQLQGMSVIKSFNLTGKGDKRIRQALEDSRENNLAVEKLFTPYIWAQEMALHLFSVVILAAAVWLYLNGSLSLANALMAVIISFLIFSQIQSAGSGVSALRLVGSSIDHANQVDDIPEMDQRGTVIRPEDHEIVFDHVNFSYGSRPILKDVSLTIPDRTTTAIVGPSGSGKTTLCNLIARFWDVDGGRVTIGGRDVREYTLESLMEQVSMVFQRVYLFADTVENNIKFGCPDATHEQVVAAAGPENKKYQGKSLSKAMEQRLFDRDFIPENNAYYPVTDDLHRPVSLEGRAHRHLRRGHGQCGPRE